MSAEPACETLELEEHVPTEFYWRRAIRSTDDPHRLRAVGLEAVREMENLREFIRALGYEPPQFRMLREEAAARRANA